MVVLGIFGGRMKKIKQNYIQFLSENFKGLKINSPLFYNWELGLRFDLQITDTNNVNYFIEVVKRAKTLFESCFSPTDNIYLILTNYKYRRRKIRISNYVLKQIKNLLKPEIQFTKAYRTYEKNDRFDIRNIAVLNLAAQRINYENILEAIAHLDFGSEKSNLRMDTEVYFINIDKKLIFYMYDDRGLDIIAADKATLLPIYTKFNEWILKVNKERIDKIMK